MQLTDSAPQLMPKLFARCSNVECGEGQLKVEVDP
jgi:hypothetical protein